MSPAIASSNLGIRPGGRETLVMSGRTVEIAMRPGHCQEFIDRVFSMPKLLALELDLAAGHARLRFETGAGSIPELLRSLAQAMRSEKPGHFALADFGLIEALSRDRPIGIWRLGGRLTFLRVKRLRPERYRFFHPAFGESSVRSAIITELLAVAYLSDQADSGWRGGFIEVEFQAGRMTFESLLEIVESALLRTVASGPRYQMQPVDFRGRLVDTNLALAILSDFLFPPARVFSVVTLWLLNARHARPTIRSLRALKFDLHVLYSAIAFLTLLSFSFIASALMYWMFEFWPRRVKALRDAETKKFLARLKRCPRSVWVERGGTETEVELSHLRLGETVILREGDVAPGDGLVLAGDALLAESWSAGLHRKEAGDIIHCSGQVARGETRIRLDSLGDGAVTSKLAEWHGQAMAAPVVEDPVKHLANSTVLPALALGVLALLRGGVSMAKAVVRPDYVTGPSISRELGWVASVIEAAQEGIYIRNDGALEKLAQCDCFVFSPGVAWRPGALPSSEIGETLGDLGVAEILMPAGSTNGSRSLVPRKRGMTEEAGDLRENDAGALIKERQYLGREVAFFGDCVAYAEAAARADVSVHVCNPPFQEVPPAEIALFEPALEGVLALRRIAMGYNDRLRGSFATALIPNAACVIGALYFGLPILGVFVLTNAGTLVNYLEAGRAVRAAARRNQYNHNSLDL